MKEKKEKKKKKESHDKQNSYQWDGKNGKIEQASSRCRREKKEIYPEDMIEMPHERQTAVLWTHKSLKHT